MKWSDLLWMESFRVRYISTRFVNNLCHTKSPPPVRMVQSSEASSNNKVYHDPTQQTTVQTFGSRATQTPCSTGKTGCIGDKVLVARLSLLTISTCIRFFSSSSNSCYVLYRRRYIRSCFMRSRHTLKLVVSLIVCCVVKTTIWLP